MRDGNIYIINYKYGSDLLKNGRAVSPVRTPQAMLPGDCPLSGGDGAVSKTEVMRSGQWLLWCCNYCIGVITVSL